MKNLNELFHELYSDPRFPAPGWTPESIAAFEASLACTDPECDGGVIPGRPRVAHDGTVDYDDRPCPTCGGDDDQDIPF